jgi:hypothetical protein
MYMRLVTECDYREGRTQEEAFAAALSVADLAESPGIEGVCLACGVAPLGVPEAVASGSGRLCHGDESHDEGARRRRALMLPILSEPVARRLIGGMKAPSPATPFPPELPQQTFCAIRPRAGARWAEKHCFVVGAWPDRSALRSCGVVRRREQGADSEEQAIDHLQGAQVAVIERRRGELRILSGCAVGFSELGELPHGS